MGEITVLFSRHCRDRRGLHPKFGSDIEIEDNTYTHAPPKNEGRESGWGLGSCSLNFLLAPKEGMLRLCSLLDMGQKGKRMG